MPKHDPRDDDPYAYPPRRQTGWGRLPFWDKVFLFLMALVLWVVVGMFLTWR